jgi:enoyl-CoA hydratase/carnithine racemase
MNDVVLTERIAAHVELVTLNRPEARNAINAPMTERLAQAVAQTEADESIWVVILTGKGHAAFSAGADLREVSLGGMSKLHTAAGGFAGFVTAPRAKPWIAAVEGFALAGGFELMLACDFTVASRDSSFGLPEVSRGLLAAAGGAYRLARSVPRAIASELIATAARFNAQRALALGLINRITEPGGAVTTALSLAEEISENAPLAVRESLAIVRRAFDTDDATLMKMSLAAQQRLSGTKDFAEGPRAFLERRKPLWSAG